MAILADWQSTLESLATAVAAFGLIAAAWGVFLARKQIKQAKEALAENERARNAQMTLNSPGAGMRSSSGMFVAP